MPEICEFYGSTEGLFSLRNWSRNELRVGAFGHTGALMRFLYRRMFVLAALDSETGELWRCPKTGFLRRRLKDKDGELLVKLSEKLSWSGYEGDEAASKKKIVRDAFQKGDVYVRSGDLMRVDREGCWYFVDRLGSYLQSAPSASSVQRPRPYRRLLPMESRERLNSARRGLHWSIPWY